MKARTLWLRSAKVVAGREFVRLNTGANTTRGNSGNGVLRIRESEPDENNTTGQLNYARADLRLFRIDSQGIRVFWATYSSVNSVSLCAKGRSFVICRPTFQMPVTLQEEPRAYVAWKTHR